jgi:hypothetical protein
MRVARFGHPAAAAELVKHGAEFSTKNNVRRSCMRSVIMSAGFGSDRKFVCGLTVCECPGRHHRAGLRQHHRRRRGCPAADALRGV